MLNVSLSTNHPPQRVGVIILNYQRSDLTLQCLRSIINTESEPILVIIVDNHSSMTDYQNLLSGVGNIKSILGVDSVIEIHLIRTERNGGFAYGCNQGVLFALNVSNIGWVWLLNSDAIVTTNYPSLKIRKFFSTIPSTSIASTIVNKYQSEEIWFEGGAFFPWAGLVRHVETQRFTKVANPFLSGCSLIIPIDVINTIGLLNENYFMYWEDLEYSIKARRQGIGLNIISDLKVEHIGAGSTGTRNPMAYRQIGNLFILLHDYFPVYIGISAGILLTLKGVALFFIRGPRIGGIYLAAVANGLIRVLSWPRRWFKQNQAI